MRKIDKLLYKVLFDEKRVNIANDIYSLEYELIWPQSQNFIEFLLASENSLKIEYAKKIYKSLILANDLFLPENLVLKVLNDQYTNLAEESEGYIGQDHFVHSINLYILGIYLIFNSNILFDKIINSETSNIYDNVISFVFKWQVFALYHDVGYYFEPYKKRKDFSKLTKLKDEILHIVYIKNLTKYIVYKTVTENSKKKFGESIDSLENNFYDLKGKPISEEQLKDKLSPYRNAVHLKEIKTEIDFNGVLPLIEDKNYITSIYDCNNILIAIIIRNRNHLVEAFFTKSLLRDELIIGKYLQPQIKNIKLRYFILIENDRKFWEAANNYDALCNNLYSKLPCSLKDSASFDSIHNLSYAVFNWVRDCLSSKESKEKLMGSCETEIIQNYFNSNSKGVTLDQLKNFFDKFLSKKEELDVLAAKLYDKKYGHSYDIKRSYEYVCKQVTNNKDFISLSKDLKIFISDSKEYCLNLFNHNCEIDYQVDLYNRLNQLSLDLDINMDLLKSYKLMPVEFDHGLVSASILYETVCINECLRNIFSTNNVMRLAWSDRSTEYNTRMKAYADIIFAVMLHNVYCKESNQDGAIDYKQNININPFSYFCSFCDVLQSWGREKQANLALTSLPERHFLEDEFDIAIDQNGFITILCMEKYEIALRSSFANSDSYLPGFSSIVNIKAI